MAEVLITLGIIGVVAALTIPNFIYSYKEKVTVTKLKKVYSVLSQGYQMYMLETGEPYSYSMHICADGEVSPYENSPNWCGTCAIWELRDTMQLAFKSIAKCDTRTDERCWPRGYYKTLLGNDYSYGYDELAGMLIIKNVPKSKLKLVAKNNCLLKLC